MIAQIKEFLAKCRRVAIVMRKPTKEELIMISKVTGLGILAIGAIGLLISLIIKLMVK